MSTENWEKNGVEEAGKAKKSFLTIYGSKRSRQSYTLSYTRLRTKKYLKQCIKREKGEGKTSFDGTGFSAERSFISSSLVPNRGTAETKDEAANGSSA